MSDGIAGGPILSEGGPKERTRWLPLWSLQVIELVVAFVFVDISVHVANSGVLVAVAVALVALAVTAQGPLGIFRVCPPRLHLVLVVVVAALAALTPAIPTLRPDIEGIIVLEFGAIGLIRVATLTETTGPRRAAMRRGPDKAVIDVTATMTDTGTEGGGPSADPEPSGPTPAGTSGGDTPGDTSGDAARDVSGAAARWAGRTAAVAATSGRQAVARHRPEAEEQVKRTIRSAGRLVGRFTTPTDTDKTGR